MEFMSNLVETLKDSLDACEKFKSVSLLLDTIFYRFVISKYPKETKVYFPTNAGPSMKIYMKKYWKVFRYYPDLEDLLSQFHKDGYSDFYYLANKTHYNIPKMVTDEELLSIKPTNSDIISLPYYTIRLNLYTKNRTIEGIDVDKLYSNCYNNTKRLLDYANDHLK
jgi:hypothetical protein